MRVEGRHETPNQGGFTLLEVAAVLVVVGLLLGAVSIGKDLQRQAEQQIIYSKFIQQWAVAYNEHVARTGVVPGDSETSPTLRVNGAAQSVLCGDDLHDLMDAAGIEMPPGRAEGREDLYIYLDSNGNPMQIQVCFKNVEWFDESNVSLNNRNVMLIRGLNPDLARNLDSTIDGRADARFGLFRESNGGETGNLVGGNPALSLNWSTDNTDPFGAGTVNLDENQVEIVRALYRMNQ